MAAIVYEGMKGGGSDLFAGKKFFVLQRVPLRERWVGAITSNGGEIVKLDKQADIIIADHAKLVNNPVGAISWTFIEKSVDRGRLEDLEDHRAGPATHTVREVGSSHPPRSGRTPFTAQDDRDLFIWIAKAERTAAAIKGNDIYKQLEAVNPRHTFQSWRDRWIKQLSSRPRPILSEEEISAAAGNPIESRYSNHQTPTRPQQSSSFDQGPAEVESTSPIKPTPRVRTRPMVMKKSSTSDPKDEQAPVKPTKVIPLVRKSTGGWIFTQEETAHMIEFYDVMAEVNDKKGVRAWAKYSVEYPNHSAQEWHDYFVGTIKPLVKNERERQKSDTKATETNLSSDAPEVETHDDLPEMETNQLENLPRRIVDPTTKDNELFVEELSAMAEYAGHEANFEPVICGRTIQLFVLWRLVNSDEFGGYDEVSGRNMWPQIARRLNFHDFRHSKAAEAIKSAYEFILPDFEVSREEYLQSLEDEALIESQLRATAEQDERPGSALDDELEISEEEDGEDDYDDDLEAPPSLLYQTQPSSHKRNIDRNDPPLPRTKNKRQRVDKGKGKRTVIPSTPDNQMNPSPTARTLYKSSPLKLQQVYGSEGSESDEILQWPVQSSSLPIKRQRTNILEPETQDFNFAHSEDGEQQASPQIPSQVKVMNAASSAPISTHEDSSTQSQNDSQKEQEMNDYVERHIALGYPAEIVLQAFESTTMSVGGVTAIVMEELLNGHGIPENMQGVWTTADDAAMGDLESEEFEQVAVKHGTKIVALRQVFLNAQREIRREEGI